MESDNAMRDLAVDMQVIRDGTVNPAYRESADKAMRIVFELSKLENKPGMDEPWWGACAGAVRRCREIAENKDGTKKPSESDKSALSQMATRLAMWTKGCDAKDNSTMVAIGTGDAVKLAQMVAELANLHFDAMGKPNYYDTFKCAMKWREIAEG